MTQLKFAQKIDRPAAEVWSVLADFEGISSWNPNLSDSYLLEGSTSTGVGARRQCDMKDGKNWIRELVTSWDDGSSYSVDIYEGTMPLKTASATLGVRPLSATTSEAYMEMDYEPKMGVLGRVMDVMMMRRMMRGSIQRLLDGLERRSAA